MATYNGKSYSDTRNLNLKGGRLGPGLLRWTAPLTGSTTLWASNPFSSNDYGLYINTSGSLVFSALGSTTVLGGGGGGGVPTWEQIFAADTTFNLAGTTWTIDNSTGNNDVLTITNTGAGSGALIQITNAGTGADIDGTSNTWTVSKLGAAGFLSVATATVNGAGAGLTLGDSGANVITIGTNTNTITLAKATTFSSTWAGTTATMSSTSNTVVELLLTNNTATTFGAAASSAGLFVVRSTSITTGTAIRAQLSESALTTGKYFEAWDSIGAAGVWSIGKAGAQIIGGVGGSDVFTVTAGDVVLSDGSITVTDADNALTLSVTNNTATSAGVVKFAGSGTLTGTTTSAFFTVINTGGTANTTAYISSSSATDSVAVVDISAAALTSGTALRITPGSGTITTGGKSLEINHGSAVAGNGITVTTTGAYTGTGMILVTAGAATTGALVSVVSTTGLTSGSLIRATSSTAGALATNGAISFTATGAFTSTSAVNGGFVEVKANSTTAGTIVNVIGTALTTGIALQLSNGTSGMTSGSLLRVTASGTGTVATNGIVSITHAGIFVSTANAGVLDVRATAMVGTASNATLVNFMTTAAAQVDTIVLNLENSGFTTGFTGSVLRVKSPTTTGACRVIDLIADGLTTTGVAMKISVAALTTGDGLLIDNGTAATTTGSLLKVTAGGTGAVSADGLVSFQHSGIYTSTTVGFLNVLASATTAGTLATFTSSAMTTGTNLQISSVGITSGKHFSVLGAAGASHFSIGVNGLTTIAGSAQGTDALVITAGDILLTSGHLDITSGNITIAGGTLSVSGATTLSGTVSYRQLTEIVTTTNVITAAESGSVFFLNSATEFVSTLPAPAAGLYFEFIVTAAPSGANYTVVTNASANIIIGKGFAADGNAGDTGTTDDTISFVSAQSVVGDKVIVECDGTNWFAYAYSAVPAGITFTTAS